MFSAIELTYQTRNTLGHNLGWPDPLDKQAYQRLFHSITASCLHVISCLYVNRDP